VVWTKPTTSHSEERLETVEAARAAAENSKEDVKAELILGFGQREVRPMERVFFFCGSHGTDFSFIRKQQVSFANSISMAHIERLKIKNFKQYVELYVSSAQATAAENSGGAAQAKPTIIYEQISLRWEIAFTVSDGQFQQVSFANSISTIKGGTHVAYIADQIAKNLVTAIQKKNKAATVKPAQIKNHIWIFVNSLIENPTFDSQTKEMLTLPASKFGSKPALSEDFMKKGESYYLILKLIVIHSPQVSYRRQCVELGEIQG